MDQSQGEHPPPRSVRMGESREHNKLPHTITSYQGEKVAQPRHSMELK